MKHNGINSLSEYLDVTFTLTNGQTFQSIIDRMVAGDFRIGMHVQSIDGGGSDSYIANPLEPTVRTNVPEPTSLLLFGTGLAFAASRFRNRRVRASRANMVG